MAKQGLCKDGKAAIFALELGFLFGHGGIRHDRVTIIAAHAQVLILFTLHVCSDNLWEASVEKGEREEKEEEGGIDSTLTALRSGGRNKVCAVVAYAEGRRTRRVPVAGR